MLQRRVSNTSSGYAYRNTRRTSFLSVDSLPDYTVVSGLPTYEEAIEKIHVISTTSNNQDDKKPENLNPEQPPQLTSTSSKLSLLDFVHICKQNLTPNSINSESKSTKI